MWKTLSRYSGYVRHIFDDLIRFPLLYLPGLTGRKLRYLYYKNKLKKCGKNVMIDEGVIIQNPEWISLGNNVWIDRYCILLAGHADLDGRVVKRKENKNFRGEEGELIIGDNVHIAPYCVIQAHGGVDIGSNSGFSSGVKVYSLSNMPADPFDASRIIFFTPLTANNAYFISPIHLSENVGVALNGIILPGVSIGKNSFVSPNSVVLGTFEENSYIEGKPAEKVKERFKAGKVEET